LLRQPAAFFLRERLGIATWDDDEPLSDEEPFAVAGLDAYRLKAEWLDAALAGRDVVAHRALVRGRGDLPEGPFGDLSWAQVETAVAPLAAVLAPQLADVRSCPARLDAGGRELVGTLQRVTPDGLVRYTVASFKPRYLLEAWVWHLALLATAPAGVARQTRLVTRDAVWVLGEVGDPRAELGALVKLHDDALREPLPFFPASAYAWLDNAADPGKAQKKACEAWEGNDYLDGEGLEAANRICWGHRADPFAPGFEDLARAVYGPLREAAQKVGKP
jgi:exodeoxyribonuclease V gamma subunit